MPIAIDNDIKTTDTLYASPRIIESVDDCVFYHTIDIPGVGVQTGEWDLRKDTDGYLGHTDFKGKRVLEVGAANGYLSFEMEKRGASVVSIDVDPAFAYDVVPLAGLNRQAVADGFVKCQYRVQNAYWMAHQRLNSKNQVYYGSGYRIPAELGSFDIGLLASVLLHNANPVAIIDQAAQRVTDKLIIVDLCHEEVAGSTLPTIQFYPSAENRIWHTWWRFSESFFTEVLKVVGFSKITTSRTTQYWKGYPFTLHTIIGER
jgi:SAM-dependent methyltransferase